MPNCNPVKSRECGKICVGWNRRCLKNPSVNGGYTGTKPKPTQTRPRPRPTSRPKPCAKPPACPKPAPIQFKLGISVNIITGHRQKFTARQGNEAEATSQLTCNEFKRIVFPDLNRIWSVAGISFRILGCRTVPALPNTQESAVGDADVSNLYSRRTLDDPEAHINIYFVPISVSLGFASMFNSGGCFITMCEWSAEGQGQRRPLQKLGQTLAHEIGHQFGLPHDPEDDARSLMYKYAVSDLVPYYGTTTNLNVGEIAVSRRYAAKYQDGRLPPSTVYPSTRSGLEEVPVIIV